MMFEVEHPTNKLTKKLASVELTEASSELNFLLISACTIETGIDRAERITNNRAENHQGRNNNNRH